MADSAPRGLFLCPPNDLNGRRRVALSAESPSQREGPESGEEGWEEGAKGLNHDGATTRHNICKINNYYFSYQHVDE